jgi:hypothetical protein
MPDDNERADRTAAQPFVDTKMLLFDFGTLLSERHISL